MKVGDRMRVKDYLRRQYDRYEELGIESDIMDLILLGIVSSIIDENMSNEDMREEILEGFEEWIGRIGNKEVLE